MQPSHTPRVRRVNHPPFKLRAHTYRKARPYLLKDFDSRCAYSMQHVSRTQMEIDHFDPSQKTRPTQRYDNLFLASRHCNRAKSDTWPSASQRKKQIRFLDCWKEQDYGTCIFEDSANHELVGTTPAAIYHIEVCDLNAPHLVAERARRSKYRTLLGRTVIGFRANLSFAQINDVIDAFAAEVETMIPPVPPPPDVRQTAPTS
jgi:hypothetical protein